MRNLSVKTKLAIMGASFVLSVGGGFWFWTHDNKKTEDELKSAEAVAGPLNRIAEEESKTPKRVQRAWDEAKYKCVKEKDSSFSDRLVVGDNRKTLYFFVDRAWQPDGQTYSHTEVYSWPDQKVSTALYSGYQNIDLGTQSFGFMDKGQQQRMRLIQTCEALP